MPREARCFLTQKITKNVPLKTQQQRFVFSPVLRAFESGTGYFMFEDDRMRHWSMPDCVMLISVGTLQ
jgi:hypothetical protein